MSTSSTSTDKDTVSDNSVTTPLSPVESGDNLSVSPITSNFSDSANNTPTGKKEWVDEELNSPEQNHIARTLLGLAPIEELSRIIKAAPRVRVHRPPTVRPHNVEPYLPLDFASYEIPPVSPFMMEVIRHNTPALRFRELWDNLPADLPARHPLNSSWVLWYLKSDRTKSWVDCLHQVSTFDSIEGFWSIINHTVFPSELPGGSDFYVFREGIFPMWEDLNNIFGGRWVVCVEKATRQFDLDRYWLELLIALIGEQFEDDAFVSGAVVNVRNKGDKIALWTKDAKKDAINYRIGQLVYKVLHLRKPCFIRYEVHKDASTRTSSSVTPRMIFPATHMKTLTPSQINDLNVATGLQAPVPKPSNVPIDEDPDSFNLEILFNEACEIQADLR